MPQGIRKKKGDGDKERGKTIDEIRELSYIPEVEIFFSGALKEAKKKFKNKINQYRDQMNKPRIKKDESPPGLSDGSSKNKSYFFEFNRVEEPGNKGTYVWERASFKFSWDEAVTNEIFSEFIKKVDEYKIDLHQFQRETVKSSTLNKSFEINFTKSTSSRVHGFVKEIEGKEEQFVLKENTNIIKVASKYQNLDKDEMYKKIFQLMEENPEVREDIFFYFSMVQKSKEESSQQDVKD